MTEENLLIITYITPVVIFAIGNIFIYRLKRYYLRQMTDFWSGDKAEKRNIEFKFNATTAFITNTIFSLVIALLFLSFTYGRISNKGQLELEKNALYQYKEQLKSDAKKELYLDLEKEFNPSKN